jgi:hypothetical protein
MGKSIVAGVFSAAVLASFARSAQAMPIAPPAPPTSSVEQARWVCNEWGRCWWRPSYYGPYGYHRYDDDYWPRRYRYGYDYYRQRYWGGYGDWRRDRDDD